MEEFHEDMIAHDKTVSDQNKKQNFDQYEAWENILFKFSTEIMHRRERFIIEDLMEKYKLVRN